MVFWDQKWNIFREQKLRSELIYSQDLWRIVTREKYRMCEIDSNKYFIITFQFFAETNGLSDVRPVEVLQDQAQCILADYVRQRYPRQLTRFGRLLLLLPCLRLVRSSTVELLFFKETLGEVSIGRVLTDIYTTDKNIGQWLGFNFPLMCVPFVDVPTSNLSVTGNLIASLCAAKNWYVFHAGNYVPVLWPF